MFNPISSHLEVKGMLGLLSAAAADDADAARIGLDVDERMAVARAVPWTRLLQHGPTTGPDGEAIDELAAWVRAHGRALVLKRSWDYGGKGVYLGNELADGAASEARLRTLLGRAPADVVGWDALVDFALADRDAWVVQELVAAAAASACCASTTTAWRRATCTSTCRPSRTSATRRGRRAAPCAPRRAAS